MRLERTIAIPHGQMCVYERCPRVERSRGLCETHYQVANRLVVIEKRTTWGELERKGKSLPLKRVAKEWFLASK